MFKLLQKVLLLSLFIFSSYIFPSALPIRRIVQVVAVRILNQSAPFYHLSAVRCLNFCSGSEAMEKVVENAAEGIEKVAVKTVEMTAEAQKTGFQNIDRSVDNKVVLSL
ncbi:hypothetical protein KBB68_01275, partial [Candidatus Babeliales bacterium]|nr:hypothetical protein [Candidatus Babeliales bacterium]